MLNLLKSDAYRIVHGRATKIGIVVLVVGISFTLWAFQTISAMNGISSQDQNFSITTTETIAQMSASATHLFGNVFIATGLLNSVGCVLAALAIVADFETGYVKTLWSVREARRPYLAEKLVLCLIAAALLLALAFFTAWGASLAMGITPLYPERPEELAQWLILTWMSTTAYLFVTAMVAVTVRNKVANIGVAILLGTGILGNLLIYLCGFLSNLIPVAISFPDWMLISSFERLADGGLGIMAYVPRLAIVAGVVIALCTTVVLTVGARKDL